MDINTWSAKACEENERFNEIIAFKITGLTDVPKEAQVGRYTFFADGKWIAWNYKDPRCRQIIREHFKIWTSYGHVGADKSGWKSCSAYDAMINNFGETIAEAECKCIEAIYATEDRYK